MRTEEKDEPISPHLQFLMRSAMSIDDVDELRLDLSQSRTLRIIGTTRDGREREWLLKVTHNERLVLV